MDGLATTRLLRLARLRNLTGAIALAAVLFQAVLIAGPATAVEPAGSFSSIESCSLTIEPLAFGPTDTVTLAMSFSPTGAGYRVGADALGAAMASVLRTATTSPDSMSVPASTIEATFGLASGSHSMDFYAVDAAGVAIGSPLCRAPYTYDGPIPEPSIDGPSELPRARVGQPYSTSTGTFLCPSTIAGTSLITSCTLSLVGYAPWTAGADGVGGSGSLEGAGGLLWGNGYSGGNGGNGGVVGLGGSYGGGIQLSDLGAGSFSDIAGDGAADFPAGLEFIQDDLNTRCGTLRGVPTQAGTYTFLHVHQYIVSRTESVTVSAVSPSDVASQTYAGFRTLTLTVEPEAAPQFTG